ncbi:MAG: DUF58 domain-containing protein, partial [Terriglobia bacterium]
MATDALLKSIRRGFRTGHAERERSALSNWKRFLAATAVLAAAFVLSLDATAFGQRGRFTTAAILAGVSLLLAGIAGAAVLPGLVRRSVLSRWAFRTRYEFTREGLIYFAIVALISIASLNTGNNLLFTILAILLGGILMSGVCSKTVLMGIELEMRLPEHIFAQQPARVHLRLKNTKRRFPSYSITVASRIACSPQERATRGQAAQHSGIFGRPIYAPYIPSRGVVVQPAMLNFPRRGRYGQDSFAVSSKFPFGILRRTRSLPTSWEIIVLPNVQPVPEIARRLPRLSAEIEGLCKGRGDDLYALRDYREGDSARHVNWKATAKSQRLKIREFTEQEENRLTFILHSRVPALDETAHDSFELMVSLCACLAWRAYEAGSWLQFISDDLKTPMARAGEIIFPVLEALAVAEPKIASMSENLFTRSGESIEGFPVIF